MRVVVTRIEADGTMQRRMVDTARHSDCRQWERLAGRVLEFPRPTARSLASRFITCL